MRARIYQRPKSAMQSGWAGTQEWVVEYEPAESLKPDPLMGWIGSSDTLAQVTLFFSTQEEAVAFAEKRSIPYDLELQPKREIKPKAYADNFRFGRMENWTH